MKKIITINIAVILFTFFDVFFINLQAQELIAYNPSSPAEDELISAVTATGIDENGKIIENPQLDIEKIITIRHRVILPFVFFDDNSAELPMRYIKISNDDAKGYYYQNLFNYETISTYFQILNIIGKRMLENPGESLTITGNNSNMGKEKGNIELSNKRALAVKKYLTDVWKIPENRLILKKPQNLPDKPSLPEKDPDKTAENRRVDLYSDKLLEPIVVTDTMFIINPQTIRFNLYAKANAGISNWKLYAIGMIKSDDKVYSGVKSLELPESIDWNIEENYLFIPRTQKNVDYYLQVTDNNDKTYRTVSKSIPVKYEQNISHIKEIEADKQLERYNLIFFDFNKSDITNRDLALIDIIKSSIHNNSFVRIYGYADRTGNASTNLKLSKDRAERVQAALGLNSKNSKVIPVGSKTLTFDNNLPEGRFYSRTVIVEIETRLK